MQGYDFCDLTLATRKLCSDAVFRDEKSKELLATYYNSLDETKKQHFDKYSKLFWDFAKRGAKKYKFQRMRFLLQCV